MENKPVCPWYGNFLKRVLRFITFSIFHIIIKKLLESEMLLVWHKRKFQRHDQLLYMRSWYQIIFQKMFYDRVEWLQRLFLKRWAFHRFELVDSRRITLLQTEGWGKGTLCHPTYLFYIPKPSLLTFGKHKDKQLTWLKILQAIQRFFIYSLQMTSYSFVRQQWRSVCIF